MAYCFIERHVNVPGTLWCECGSLVAGTPIDGYNVVSYLGHGTSGDVYVAEQPALNNRKVVIKIAHRSWNQSDIENFRREAALLASLSHPYILPIYAYGVIYERQSPTFTYSPYLVLPYAEQGSLEEAFMRTGRRPWPLMSVVSMAQEVAEALDYAHARGVLHRDVKPANLLNMGSHVVLSDFSVASLIDAEVSHVNAPWAGSPAYMAPEVWRRNPGRYSDQYALAVTCFRLLAGEYPWAKMSEGNVQTWLHLHCHVPPRSLQTYRPNLPGAVDLVLQMGMAKDPHKRYETVQAFAADLLDASEDKTQVLGKSAQGLELRPQPLDVQTGGKEWQNAIGGGDILVSNAPAEPTRDSSLRVPTAGEDSPIIVTVEPVTESIQRNVRAQASPAVGMPLVGSLSIPSSSPPMYRSNDEQRSFAGAQDDSASAKALPLVSRSPERSEGDVSRSPEERRGRDDKRGSDRRSASEASGSYTQRWLWYALLLNGLIAILLAAEAYWQWKDILTGVDLFLALWPSVLIGPLLARWFRRLRLTTLSWGIFWGVFFGMTNVLLSGLVCYIWVALGRTFLEWGSAWHQVSDGLHVFVSQMIMLAQPALTPLLLGLWLGVLGGAILGIFMYRNEHFRSDRLT